MNAVFKQPPDQTPLARALVQRADIQRREAETLAKDQAAITVLSEATASGSALDQLRGSRVQAMADIEVNGSTAVDLPSLEKQIAVAAAKHEPIAHRAEVATEVRKRLAAQRTALREELQAVEAELPTLAHAQLRDALGASATDFLTTRDYFFDQVVESFAHARACDLLMQRAPGSVPSALQRVSQLVIPMPQHEAFLSDGPPRNLAQEIEKRAQQLLAELSA